MASDKNTLNNKSTSTFKERLVKKDLVKKDPQTKFIAEKYNKLVQQFPANLGSIKEGKYEEEAIIDLNILNKMSEKELKEGVKELLAMNAEALESKKAENISDDKKLILKGLLEEINDIKKIMLENSFEKINISNKQKSSKPQFKR